MKVIPFAKTKGGQDGAIWGDWLFRLNSKGLCRVYHWDQVPAEGTEREWEPVSEFTLSSAEVIVPHSNAVCFGIQSSREEEFPLLYSNVYNNYAKETDRKKGVLCVYRLRRKELDFSAQLVQLIRIGFTEDSALWCSESAKDVRPYGNFIIDREKGELYAFVMRDEAQKTRYFRFSLPKLGKGREGEIPGVEEVVLSKADVLDYFDVPYHRYVQGAAFHEGKIYSVEGFHERIHPALRIVDPKERKEVLFYDFYENGFFFEAEFIDFHRGVCYYSDAKGNLFALSDFSE